MSHSEVSRTYISVFTFFYEALYTQKYLKFKSWLYLITSLLAALNLAAYFTSISSQQEE